MFRQIGNRGVVLLVMALAILASGRLPLQAQNTTVAGVVKNASGEPVAGALVRVRSADLGLTFMVVSQAQGRYTTFHLLPGKYTVQAFGGSSQSEPSAPVEVAAGQQGKMDVSLSSPRPAFAPRKRMTQADYAAMLPEGDAKGIITSRCSICHGLDVVAMSRQSRQEWEEALDLMKFYMDDRRIPLSDQEQAAIVEYAATHFGANSPRARAERAASDTKHLPRPLLTGAEAKYVVMEYNLKPGASPHDISVDSQGNAWVSERGNDLASISKFDPKTLTYTRIPPPPGKVQARPSGIAVDPRDMVWAIDNSPNSRMIAYNTRSREFNTFDIPAPPKLRAAMNTIRFSDGLVWGSGIASSQIYKLDPATRKVDAYSVPRGRTLTDWPSGKTR